MHRDRIDKSSSAGRVRLGIQIAFAALFNGYVTGFSKGRIYGGPLKGICVPVLNCYSCPGALGACPIGSLQAVAGGHAHSFSFYAAGILALVGVVIGRLVCGFMCPFGLVQDLLYRIRSPKIRVPEKADKKLRLLKYFILFFVILLLPAVASGINGIAEPFFCKYLCPAGTLEAGIPLLIKNKTLRDAAGSLFIWKVLILIAFIVSAVIISRCWCKYLCPLGAFYALFNRISVFSLAIDEDRCIGCGACSSACPMDIDVQKEIGGAECIKCGKCRPVCPASCIHTTVCGSAKLPGSGKAEQLIQ